MFAFFCSVLLLLLCGCAGAAYATCCGRSSWEETAGKGVPAGGTLWSALCMAVSASGVCAAAGAGCDSGGSALMEVLYLLEEGARLAAGLGRSGLGAAAAFGVATRAACRVCAACNCAISAV